jgi:hypothetical protein
MRVLCLEDNDLADAIVEDGGWDSICMDDIATPGSFWLNPPHPRDDKSNTVDPEQVMEMLESKSQESKSQQQHQGDANSSKQRSDVVLGDSMMMSDDELKAILADMDPL